MVIRFKRLAAEVQMRRRRLDAYRSSPPWPGKGTALRYELTACDRVLVLAAHMLEVPAPDPSSCILAPEARVVLDDRLAVAGPDVLSTSTPDAGYGLEDSD